MRDDHLDDDDGDGRDWHDSSEGRRAAISSDVRASIAKAGWKFNRKNKDELLIPQADKNDRLDLLEDLNKAGINCKIDIKGDAPKRDRKIVVQAHDLDTLVPEWRDVSYPEDIMHAITIAGWKISKKSTDTAQVIIEGQDELRDLTQDLNTALIPYELDAKAKSGGVPGVVSVKVADLDFLIPKWRTAAVPEEVKQDLIGAGWQFSLSDDHLAFVTFAHPDESSALTTLLDEANIHYVINQGQGGASSQRFVTVNVEDLDRLLGNEWRETSITPEVRDCIAKAGWVIEKKEAYFTSEHDHEVSVLGASLQSAGIDFHAVSSIIPPYQQSIFVDIDLLDKYIPEWRDASAARALEDAKVNLKQDAEKRAERGRSWQEGDAPKQGVVKPAIMFCKDKSDADELVKLLKAADIEPRREGADGKIVVTSVEALERVGIAVKTVENEVESEEQQQEGARKWLKNKVTWKMASESSPLARAFFTNGGEVSNALESLLALQCTKDLKRLSRDTLMKDNSGLMLEVNADALKAVVPGVSIAPFNHAQSTGREDDERRTGR